jgi:two-component system heavy metal sensor histidine kinase CusS
VSAAPRPLRRALAWLRRSMTAQIALSVTLVAMLIVAVVTTVSTRLLRGELREENELLLVAHLAFLRDDLAAVGYDLAKSPALLERTAHRVHRLQLAVLDAERRPLAASPGFEVPVASLRRASVVDAGALPTATGIADFEEARRRFGDRTSIWESADGNGQRLLVGRIDAPARDGGAAGPFLVALSIATTDTREVRSHDTRNLLVGLAVAAVSASLLGVAVARRIVVSARRLGAAASRIGAQELGERLAIEDAPVELEESTIAFNRMLDRLQESFERLSAFSSDLAHDLRTPIGNLLGEAQVVLSRPRTAEEYRSVLESAVEEYERLSRMISNMLFLARADNRRAAVSAGWVELGPALERVTGYFEVIAEERGVRLQRSLHADGAECRVWADETMLIRAVGNLVSNALRHAPPGSVIEIATRAGPDGGCVIEVSNDGEAIAPEHQARVFDRFYRADASRHASASSSGLGLAIVRSVMDLHEGHAWLRSAPGERTVFGLRFPPPPTTTGAG